MTLRLARLSERIYLCTQNEIRVFLISKKPRKYKIISTGENVKGLMCLTPAENEKEILIFPGSPGEIRIMDFNEQKYTESLNLIQAHDSDVSYIAMDNPGDLIATASVKGTIIRVFNIKTKEKIHELRRGVKHVDILCINFSRNSEYVCVSSNKGTIHVFSLKGAEELVKSSWYSLITNPRSYAVVKSAVDLKSICFFNSGGNLSVLGRDGVTHQYTCKVDGRLELTDEVCLL